MTVLRIVLQVLLALTSLFLTLLILLHKGKGGGLSDMFGGGMSASVGSSGVAERNLNRITVANAVLWAAVVVALGLVERFDPSGS
ncbi:preprotein translocase subunit SecG [Quadrisphaera setariae]|uniref:Protein-export membrane protein SecG n=1 Tax=Quadrisphaera setariae TaxID=2593304 RepID=A0A5C8ZHI7_9ACTN|nr:preprotein translocase subunit SecG [Quadrisphaera setariae]TNM64608.1 preprotein translocase subunit SecG [Streptomyces sp. NP160]TXR57515.1 preprotein translocase subunit SecG [Quadrisphaera setariae]